MIRRPATDAPAATPAALPGHSQFCGGEVVAGFVGVGLVVTLIRTYWVLVKTAPLDEYVSAFVVTTAKI